MESSNQPVLTFDIDWAPDWVIDTIADRLIDKQIRATWFVTHQSEAVARLARCDLFELGIHPNITKNSSHGSSEEDVLEHLCSIVPGAVSMRTHGLFQSSSFLVKAATKFGIEIDLSLFLPRTAHLEPHQVRWFGMKLWRLPYFWEDDSEMFEEEPIWSLNNRYVRTDGLKIFDFHPIHIVLNTRQFEQYEQLKKISPVSEWTEEFVAVHRASGEGPATLLDQIIENLSGGGQQVRELVGCEVAV